MSDPRNVAHAKKVTQEKHHHQAKARPEKRRKSLDAVQNQPVEAAPAPANAETIKVEQKPGDLEKSLAVLSSLKIWNFIPVPISRRWQSLVWRSKKNWSSENLPKRLALSTPHKTLFIRRLRRLSRRIKRSARASNSAVVIRPWWHRLGRWSVWC